MLALAVAGTCLLAACGGGENDTASPGSSTGAVEKPSGTVITYNTPKEFANYGEVLSGFSKATGVKAPNDPKNSGQTLAALQAEAGAPAADMAYYGITFGIQAAEAGVVTEYEPERADEVPAELKDPDGRWITVHTGTIAFLVNRTKLDGAPVPASWADLLKPEYKGKVGYLDPTQAAVGYNVATAVNLALGGSLDDFGPGLDYLEKLKANGAVTPAQTATAKVAQGEIPILIDADFNGYNLKDEGAPVDVVIPEEGSISIPYVVSLVKDGPNPAAGKALMDYLLSDDGQALFAEGFVRPIVGGYPDSVADKVNPAEDYERAEAIDYAKQAEAQPGFIAEYKASVQ
jgi:putative spermidine/putrescine transport system substrate-binding protein